MLCRFRYGRTVVRFYTEQVRSLVPASSRYTQGIIERLKVEPYQFDAGYVARLAAGDPQTCNHFAEYFTRVLDLVLAIRERDADRAREIRQNTLLQVLINLHRDGGIESPERFAAYVMGICRNKLREEIRDRVRNPRAPEAELWSKARSVEEEFITEQNKERAAAVIAEMSDWDRRVIQLIYLEDAEREDACRELGISREGLRVRLHRAVRRFKELYMKKYGS